MGNLLITALAVNTQIGVHAWEQRIKQKLLIDINLPLDCSACDDSLDKTVDYQALCDKVTQFVESRAFKLIETVAQELALFIVEVFKVPTLTVSVSKPQAIINAGNIQVVVQLP